MKKIILTLLFVINVFPCFVGDFWQCGTLVFSQEQMGQEDMCEIDCPDNSVEEYPCEWNVSICEAKVVACRDCGAKLEEGQVCSCKSTCPCGCAVSNCTGDHCNPPDETTPDDTTPDDTTPDDNVPIGGSGNNVPIGGSFICCCGNLNCSKSHIMTCGKKHCNDVCTCLRCMCGHVNCYSLHVLDCGKIHCDYPCNCPKCKCGHPNCTSDHLYACGKIHCDDKCLEAQELQYQDACDGLAEAWSRSFNDDGSIYREANGYIVKKVNAGGEYSFIMDDQMGNTVSSSVFPGVYNKYKPNMTFYIYNNEVYEIVGMVHTHPDCNETQGPSDESDGEENDWTSLLSANNNKDNSNVAGVIIADDNVYVYKYINGNRVISDAIDRSEFISIICESESYFENFLN